MQYWFWLHTTVSNRSRPLKKIFAFILAFILLWTWAVSFVCWKKKTLLAAFQIMNTLQWIKMSEKASHKWQNIRKKKFILYSYKQKLIFTESNYLFMNCFFFCCIDLMQDYDLTAGITFSPNTMNKTRTFAFVADGKTFSQQVVSNHITFVRLAYHDHGCAASIPGESNEPNNRLNTLGRRERKGRKEYVRINSAVND